MSWQLSVTGTSDDPQTEIEMVDFFRRVFSVFREDNAPCELTNVVLVGSNTTTHNLLSNPEPPPEESAQPATPPVERKPWTPKVPTEPAPFASNLSEEEAANLPPAAVVHGSGADTGQAPVIPPVTSTETTSEGGV